VYNRKVTMSDARLYSAGTREAATLQVFALVPAYQPDERLVTLAQELDFAGCSVIVVDDGSSPDKKMYFDGASKYAKIIAHSHNMGKGAAIKTGIRYIAKSAKATGGAVIVVVDCDGQHLPQDALRVAREAAANPGCLVLGVRDVGQKMPLRSRFGNTVTRAVFRLLSGVYISDTQTGLRAFDSSLFDLMLEIEGMRYEYEINVLMRLAKERVPIREVPIETIYHDRKNTVSHFRTLSDSYKVFAGMLRAADMPMLKFTVSSLLSFCVDFMLFNIFLLFFERYRFGEVISNVCARVFSSVFNYRLNCGFVFRSKSSAKSFFEYSVLAALILFFNTVLLVGYTKLKIAPRIAKLLTEITLFVVSFTIQRFVIFRNKRKPMGIGQKK
jgi:putative flippase GtrA